MDDDAIIAALKSVTINKKPIVVVRDPLAPSNRATRRITVFCKHCKTEYTGMVTYWVGYAYCVPKDGDGMDWCPNCIKERAKEWCKHAWSLEVE
jgi:hypothetical protein